MAAPDGEYHRVGEKLGFRRGSGSIRTWILYTTPDDE
jgi:hypothetical protein